LAKLCSIACTERKQCSIGEKASASSFSSIHSQDCCELLTTGQQQKEIAIQQLTALAFVARFFPDTENVSRTPNVQQNTLAHFFQRLTLQTKHRGVKKALEYINVFCSDVQKFFFIVDCI